MLKLLPPIGVLIAAPVLVSKPAPPKPASVPVAVLNSPPPSGVFHTGAAARVARRVEGLPERVLHAEAGATTGAVADQKDAAPVSPETPSSACRSRDGERDQRQAGAAANPIKRPELRISDTPIMVLSRVAR